jgi:hypothetical protein
VEEDCSQYGADHDDEPLDQPWAVPSVSSVFPEASGFGMTIKLAMPNRAAIAEPAWMDTA